MSDILIVVYQKSQVFLAHNKLHIGQSLFCRVELIRKQTFFKLCLCLFLSNSQKSPSDLLCIQMPLGIPACVLLTLRSTPREHHSASGKGPSADKATQLSVHPTSPIANSLVTAAWALCITAAGREPDAGEHHVFQRQLRLEQLSFPTTHDRAALALSGLD